jgi:xylose isomerase
MMKTSLGIWAFGPMITRFVPSGHQPQHGYDPEPIAGGLHLDPRFGRGGLVNPDERVRRLGVKLFLEHKNSEPAMKILVRNVGMCLHVIHKLRADGIDNIQVNMDWQHLLMDGEHLPEYAALLAAEGLLGHQHANSGWGTFDDDNMIGATAFMETIELALELRRCGYGSRGERLGFDLYPYTEDQVAAVKRSVHQWRFIDSVAARIDDQALGEAQRAKDAVRPYELLYAALGA